MGFLSACGETPLNSLAALRHGQTIWTTCLKRDEIGTGKTLWGGWISLIDPNGQEG